MKGIKVQCPFCGHEWTYKGFDKHYATCPGRGDMFAGCDKKVRLHPYLIRTKKKMLSPLRYPNDNYRRWWDE